MNESQRAAKARYYARKKAAKATEVDQSMSWREANSKGGSTTAESRTADERRDQASLGGHAASAKLGHDHFAAMGTKGAAESKRRKPGTPRRIQILIDHALRMRDDNEP